MQHDHRIGRSRTVRKKGRRQPCGTSFSPKSKEREKELVWGIRLTYRPLPKLHDRVVKLEEGVRPDRTKIPRNVTLDRWRQNPASNDGVRGVEVKTGLANHERRVDIMSKSPYSYSSPAPSPREKTSYSSPAPSTRERERERQKENPVNDLPDLVP